MQNVMIELSMYPLAENYREEISAFIKRLNTYPELACTTSSTSTQIVGEYQAVFAVLGKELAAIHAQVGQTIFVAKCMSWDLMQVAADA